MTLGGRRVIVQDENAPGESGIEMSGPGWTRTLLNDSKTEVENGAEVVDESLTFLQALNRSKGKEKKREYEERSDAPHSPVANDISVRRSPPRKKIKGLDEINIPTGVNRALLSPLPSPNTSLYLFPLQPLPRKHPIWVPALSFQHYSLSHLLPPILTPYLIVCNNTSSCTFFVAPVCPPYSAYRTSYPPLFAGILSPNFLARSQYRFSNQLMARV